MKQQVVLIVAAVWSVFASLAFAADKPNVLIITADDLSADSIGSFGCKLAGTSPNIDRLATQGMRFEYAHVDVANCMPSRGDFVGPLSAQQSCRGLLSGCAIPGYPVMTDLMKVGRLLHRDPPQSKPIRRRIRPTPGTWI